MGSLLLESKVRGSEVVLNGRQRSKRISLAVLREL